MNKKILVMSLTILFIASLCLSGCSTNVSADFSGVQRICELSTIKTLYHNTVIKEYNAGSILGLRDKYFVGEYMGFINYGIDASKIIISQPDEDGVVKVELPDADIINYGFMSDLENFDESKTKEGFFISDISNQDKADAIKEEQEVMMKKVMEDSSYEYNKSLAKLNAKELIKNFIVDVGKNLGKSFKVEFK